MLQSEVHEQEEEDEMGHNEDHKRVPSRGTHKLRATILMHDAQHFGSDDMQNLGQDDHAHGLPQENAHPKWGAALVHLDAVNLTSAAHWK